jgi:preprotein translocase subunit SecD
MAIWTRRFNLYFAPTAALAVLCGCQWFGHKGPEGALRIHIQTSPDTLGASQTINVVRAEPVQITVSRNPILTEANIVSNRVINTPGGFAIEVRFDENGTWLLEQYTAANPGLHFAIFGQWGDKLANGRWLAAPLITRRIANGVLVFTPDASRDEADQLVLGVNTAAAKMRKGQLK